MLAKKVIYSYLLTMDGNSFKYLLLMDKINHPAVFLGKRANVLLLLRAKEAQSYVAKSKVKLC